MNSNDSFWGFVLFTVIILAICFTWLIRNENLKAKEYTERTKTCELIGYDKNSENCFKCKDNIIYCGKY